MRKANKYISVNTWSHPTELVLLRLFPRYMFIFFYFRQELLLI